ncbi:MAG: hypothetical protein GY724_13735 [Actinomycetia bacterium]|nr:hypothetical protein [Actinomycetes bacterium]MCP5031092.1 hypothetical protein [Actinomycetes bacterium]
MELPRRISTRQLNIERNRPRNELMIVGTAEFRRIGPFTIDVIGPTTEAVEDLEARWRKWLGRSQKALRRLQAEMLEDEKRLSGLDAGRLPDPRLDTALGEGTITAPNLASLVLLIKDESGSTILLTGDGSSEDILTGLGQCEKLDDNGTVHVDILKVQHHGAEANVTEDFVNRVGADHSVFCRKWGPPQPGEERGRGHGQGPSRSWGRTDRTEHPLHLLVHQRGRYPWPVGVPERAHD